ncbi:ferredoxin--NADP reductase [Paracidobacterium acidisoli]|uniref:FAD-dependent oxidoreductase n=1 Tax=Paracidobacterium acidisoli TaxID=2303751 RepID=A0A372IND8_9BACT|nr:FAD-dependent oxidoreductase [Paracidobacterium acidisoli]MBT9332138.1 FAD-dependent oxidoreductase [Paracidobacterium acidisoli]
MPRQLFTARLDQKLLLSESAQCYHLEFTLPELERFDFSPGQFVSTVAVDTQEKQQTRAYSIASAPEGNRFALCVNRVEGGFFSNLLCDLSPGETVQVHGPHGLFVPKEPLTDSIFIATGTGIAPMRGFVEWLFPENGEDRSEGRKFWLVYGTRHETEIYYQKYFEKIAAEHPNFQYLSSLSRPHEGWEGLRGYVQDHVAQIVERRTALRNGTAHGVSGFDIYAYICGLNDMVSATRDRLKGMGWDRKQIVFERYD